jgi:hypothetical protein
VIGWGRGGAPPHVVSEVPLRCARAADTAGTTVAPTGDGVTPPTPFVRRSTIDCGFGCRRRALTQGRRYHLGGGRGMVRARPRGPKSNPYELQASPRVTACSAAPPAEVM